MSISPEYNFQPHIVFGPNNKSIGDRTVSPIESPNQSPLVEAISSPNQSLEIVKLHTGALLGLAPEQVQPILEDNQSLPSSQRTTIDSEQIRAKRREHFEQTGYIPPMMGGSPRQRLESPEEMRRKDIERHVARAAEVGLPASATEEEIEIQRDRNKRKELAIALRWPLDPRLSAKLEHAGHDPYPQWETILYHALNMSGRSRNQLTSEEIAECIKIARNTLRKMNTKSP